MSTNTPRTRTLAPGVEIPLLGFGTYLVPDAQAADVVHDALRAGYRHVDTAEFYENERGVGEGIRRAMKSEALRREDVFVTTKLFPGNAAWGQTPKSTETTIAALESSLSKLGMDHVDLYLVHAPFDPEQRLAQWRGMIELKKQGKARAIGVSNFDGRHIDGLVAAGLPKPEANQIELHPWSQKPALVRYLGEHHIVPIAYSSLAPLDTWRTAEGHRSRKSDVMKADGARSDSPFKRMAAKYGVSEARLLLRWAIELGYPILPKSTRPERIRENADVFSFAIDAADMAELATMDRGDGIAWPSGEPTAAR